MTLHPRLRPRAGGRRRLGGFAAAVLLLLVCVLVTPTGASARDTSCEFRHGPEYTIAISGHTWKASGYSISGFGISCGYMKTWVGRLAKQPYTGKNKPVRHGPPGWRCRSDYNVSGEMTVVLRGACQNPARTKSFRWVPNIGDAVPVRQATPPQAPETPPDPPQAPEAPPDQPSTASP